MSIRPADIRDVALMGLATMAAVLLAPSLEVVGVPLGALATGWLSYRYGTRTGVVTAVVATVSVTTVAAVVVPSAAASAVFTLPALLAAGPGTVWALRRWRATSVVAALVGVLFVSAAAGLWAQAAMMGTTVMARYAEAAKVTGKYIARILESQDVGSTAAFNAQLAALVKDYALLWPSDVFLSAALVAALAVPAVSLLGRRMGMTVARMPALADLDLSFHLVWPTIAGIALLAADAYRSGPTGWTWAVGMNLLIAVRVPLFLQGLASFAALYRRVGVGRLGRFLGFTVLTVGEIVVPSVSVVGMVDLFFNLRKMPRGGAGTVPGQA